MALQQTQLSQALESVFSKTRQSSSEAARGIAQAYAAYAQAAMAGPAAPVLTGSEQQLLATTLGTALAEPRSGTSLKFAQALASGVQSFWLAPPVAFAGPGATGIASLFPGAVALPVQLAASLSNPRSSLQAAASNMAAALHTATLTVIVLVTIPPAPPVPLPLT